MLNKGALLIEVATKGDVTAVAQLLKANANVNHANSHGSTALMEASDNGHELIVEQLLEAKANVNHATGTGWTALIMASDKGCESIVVQLLEAKADVNHATKMGGTALIEASAKGRERIVAQLLEAKADVNYAIGRGFTALMVASVRGRERVVAQLLEAGARADIYDEAFPRIYLSHILDMLKSEEAVIQRGERTSELERKSDPFGESGGENMCQLPYHRIPEELHRYCERCARKTPELLGLKKAILDQLKQMGPIIHQSSMEQERALLDAKRDCKRYKKDQSNI